MTSSRAAVCSVAAIAAWLVASPAPPLRCWFWPHTCDAKLWRTDPRRTMTRTAHRSGGWGWGRPGPMRGED
eukprot:9461479-Pyramimonas_sp.AAC.1